ncbi:MAG: methyltransferase domain-containing protein [Solirubrobacteraceae bacterium]
MNARAGAVETWDRHALRYGRQARHELRALRTAAALAGPGPSDRVLDVATGTGLMLDVLRMRADPPRRLLAIDRSAGMLARLGPLLPDGWSTQRADATALPLADRSVDVATVAYLLQLLPAADRAAVLDEMQRVLAPGGRVVTVTPHVTPRGTQRIGAAILNVPAAIAPARLGGLRTHDPRAELTAAGFTVQRGAQLRHGYPSLVLLARRR